MKLRLWQKITIFVILLLFIFCAMEIFARAGGAGGFSGSSGSSRGTGDGGAIIWVIILLMQTIGPIPTAIIIIIALIILSIAGKKMKAQSPMKNMQVPSLSAGNIRGYKEFIKGNPDFKEEVFKEKVSRAFILIQQAWSEMDISKVRRFISDGLYQRFTSQFVMMRLLKQKNIIDSISIKEISFVKFMTDGRYDSVDVAITASMKDVFTCETNHSLDTPRGTGTFTEFWSFLRRRGISSSGDIYSDNKCPKCGAQLPEQAGDVAKCEYCGVLTNTGEYDWVLSEITQARDYFKGTALKKAQNLKTSIAELIQENDDFSVQLIEDKASNGYMQIKTALVTKKPERMRRFVTDEVFEKIKASIPEKNIVYNRLYLNDVSLIGINRENSVNALVLAVTSSFQRVELREKGKAKLIDPSIISETEVMIMEREKGAQKSKGSLYSHTCPSCGGPLSDTMDIKCSFCGSLLNNPKLEWIITGLMSMAEYRVYHQEKAKAMTLATKPETLDALFEVKDYALNNMLVMIGADGVFAEEEREFAETIAKKWGFNTGKIEPLFNLAKSGKLGITMPEDPAKRKAIYQLMEKAAAADHTVCPEEKAVLEFVQSRYL